MQKNIFNLSTIAIFLGLLFVVLISIRTISTPEVWTHLAQGKTDAPLSFLDTPEATAPFVDGSSLYDTPVNTTHLYDKILYALWGMGGATALILLNLLLILFAFILLIRTSVKWGGGLSQGFAILLCGHILFQNLDVGPQTVAMFFIALFIYLFSTMKKPALIFATLIPLQILWANLHGSFFFGSIIAFFFAIEAWKTAKAKTRNHLPKVSSNTYWILMLLLAVVPMANPSFFGLYKQVVHDIANQAPLYNSTMMRNFYLIPNIKPLIFFTFVLGASGLVSYKKTLPFALTSLAILGGLITWSMPQFAHLFVPLTFPFIVLSFSATGASFARSIRSFVKNRDRIFIPLAQALFIFLLVFSLIPILSGSAYSKIMSASSMGFGVEDELYPNDLAELFADPAFPEKFVNLPADGGYIAFNYGKKVFVDYRPGRYPDKLLLETEDMLKGDIEAYNSIVDKYRPEALVINTLDADTSSGLPLFLSSKLWRLAYFDGTTVVLIQNDPKFNSIINNKALQQKGLDKIDADLKIFIQKIESGKKPKISPRLFGAANFYLALNRYEQSEELFTLLVKANPRRMAQRIGLGKCQFFLKKYQGALENFEIVIKKEPDNLFVWGFYATTCQKLNLPEKQKTAQKEIERIVKKRKEEAKKKAEKEAKKDPVVSTNAPASTL